MRAAPSAAISWIVMGPLIASIATMALKSGLWVRRLLIGGSPFQGRCPASEVNDGGCPEKLDHLSPPLGTLKRPLPLTMPDPAAFGPLLAAVFGPAPSKRRVMLRPRPPYLPHPIRRLTRLPGVVRVSSKP